MTIHLHFGYSQLTHLRLFQQTLNNDGKNEKFIIDTQTPLEITIVNRWGKKLHQAKNYNNDWPKKDISAGIYYYDIIFPDGISCHGWIQVLK